MKTDTRLRAIFGEVMHNPPAAVTRERRKKGPKMAHKMEIAISLSKARRAGVPVPKKKGT